MRVSVFPEGIAAILIAVASLACGSSDGAVDANVTPDASVVLEAKNLHFDKKALVVPAETAVTVTLLNDDHGVRHNFAVYTNKRAVEKIFVGDLFNGVDTMGFTFMAPAPGTYFFRCDIHPDSMTGTFVTKESNN